MNRPDPFPLDKSRVRRVHPISAEQLARIMDEVRESDGEPVPSWQAAGIFAGLIAGAIMGWGLMYAAARLVAVGVEMFR